MTVGEDFPNQQERVRALLTIYEALPLKSGAFGARMIREALRRADEAAISGDILKILESYEELRSFQA